MKKLLILSLFLIAAVTMLFAGIVDYYNPPVATNGTYVAITGTSAGAGGDTFMSPALDIGFNFYYCGTVYTQVKMASDGYLVIGTALTSSSLTNALASTTNRPVIAPLWDDQTSEGMSYTTLGLQPNRVFVAQWANTEWNYNGTAGQNFQVRLYEADYRIEIIYGTMITPTSPSASIGLNCFPGGSGNYYSITPGAPITYSTTTENTSINAITYLTSGTTYTFTPIAPTTYPNLPTAVSPANLSTGIFVNSILNWADGGGWTESFKLYFGTTNPPAEIGNIGYVTSWDPPGDMSLSTTYYWKVEPYNTAYGYNTSQTTPWSFATSDPPLTGTKTIGGTTPDYATFTAAIGALNGSGVGTGGVTFIVRDGTYNENPPAITVSGTAANQIKFQADTGANPVVTPAGGAGTFGFKLSGADWITFDNIDVSGPNTLIYGYWLSALTDNATNNNTIKNCTITVPYGSSTNYGIYSYYATNAPNTGNTYLNNTIDSNTYYGIYVYGSSTAGNENQSTTIQDNVFSGIRNYAIYHYNGIGTVISGNTIAYANGTVGIYGIYSSGSASTTQIFGNIIDDGTGGSNTSTHYGFYILDGNNQIYNNTLRNVAVTTNSHYGFYITGGTNIIYSNTISDLSSTTGSMYAMYLSSGTNTVYGMTVYNLVSTTGSQAGIYMSGGATEVYNSTFRNFSPSGIATIYGAYVTTGNHIVRNCNFHTYTSTGTIYGVYVIGGTSHQIYANNIYNLTCNSSSTLFVTGIMLSSATTNVYNNMIYNLKAPTATTSPQVRGISVTGGTAHKIYYNSMLLDATSTAINFGSACLYTSSSTANLIDLRNNVFVNRSTPGGTGLAAVIHKSTTGFTVFTSDTNRNLYYAGAPDATHVIGLFATTAYPALADYRAAAATIEGGSYTEENTFFRSSVDPFDLRISDSAPTQVESGGANITGITTDMYGTIRQGNPGYAGTGTAPDLGAHEGNFTSQDLAAPVISFTPLLQTISTGDRTIAGVTITDATGVDIEGGEFSPRVYYTLEPAGEWFSNTGTYVSGTALSSVWDFTILSADLSGLAVGSTVYYYVIAQDTATRPNVGSMPAGAVADDVNTITTHPATPYSYLISPSYSGDIQVGTGNTFTSLTADDPAGLFKTLNNGVITGNINVLITSDLTETGAIALNQTTEAGTGNYTITIKPSEAVLKTISGSLNSSGLIRLNDADRVVFDGRFAGSGKFLTFANTSTTAPQAISLIRVSNGAQNVTIRNCNIGTALKTGGYAINAGADSDNLSIIDNYIPMAGVGIYVVGTSTNVVDNLTITGNVIGNISDDVNTIGVGGISITQVNTYTMANNRIENIVKSATTSPYGVTLGANAINGIVSNNTIDKVVYTGTGGYGAFGIDVSTANAASNVIIVNNMISRITSDSDDGSTDWAWAPAGIRITGTAGGLSIYYNSVMLSWMYHTTAYEATSRSAAIYIPSGAVNLDIRNNIFFNNSFYPNTTGPKAYAIYSAAPNTAFTNINYNDYFVAGTQGVFGYLGTEITNLSGWRTATGQDAASVFGDPKFTSISNLHIRSDEASWVESRGQHLASYPTDIDANIRWNSPGYTGAATLGTDIGADEGDFIRVEDAVAPTAQPTSLVLIPGSTTVNGSFNASLPASEAYLVVASAAPLSGDPVNGVVYSIGNQLGGGTVAKIGSSLSFSSVNLNNSTLYYYTVFSYTVTGAGAPLYLVTSPLVGSVTTLGAPPTNPASVVPTAVATDQISIVTQPNGIPNNVLLAYSLDGVFGTPLSNINYTAGATITGGGTVLANGAAGTYLHTGLNTFTRYYYKAWSVNQEGAYYLYSAGITANTFTFATIPLTENFDASTAFPMGWAKVGSGGSAYISTSTPYSSPNNLYMYSGSSSSLAVASLPTLSLNNQSLRARFFARSASTNPVLQIGYLTNPTDATTFVSVSQVVATATYTQYVLPIGTVNGVFYPALRVPYNANSVALYVDDVNVEEMQANDLAATPLTGPGFGFVNTPITHNVNVMNLGSATQNSYDVNLKRYGDDMLAGTLHVTTPLASSATASHAITWTPTSLWTGSLYAEVVLSGDNNPTNNTSANFTFGVYPEGALVEGFESGIIPNDWTILNVDADPYQWDVQSTNPHSGTYHARCHWNSSVNNDWLITPPLEVTSAATGDQISFWIGKFSSTWPEDWQVLISTTDTNVASFTMIDSGDIPAVGYIQKTYNLDSYGDAVIYLAIRYVGTNDFYIYVDDFIGPKKYIPQSPVVTTSVLGTSVKLTWPAVSHARSYQILEADDPYGTFVPLITVSGTEYTITTPAAKKFYKVISSTNRYPGRAETPNQISRDEQMRLDAIDAQLHNKQY